MLFSSLKLCRSLPLILLLASTSTTVKGDEETSEDIAAYLSSVVAQYKAFPAIDPDPSIWETGNLKPIDVFAIQTILAIDSITPGASEFTATTRASYYWTSDDCGQSEAHEFACNTTLSDGEGLKFFTSKKAKDLPTRILHLDATDIHSTVFEEDGRTDLRFDAEQVETRARFSHSFDMRYYPWEIHALEIPLTSLYTSNVVKVTRFPDNIEAQVEPKVPNGWEYLGTKCSIFLDSDSGRVDFDEDGETSNLEFYTYSCHVVVARTNPGWWVTSFLLFSAMILMAYVGSVGITSHMVAEARDDRDSARRALYDGTRLVGTYTIGLLLTYVFQVQISPYGQSVEYWPRVPTSTMIYVLGLMGIVVQSFAGLIGSAIFTRPLLAEGFEGGFFGPYNFDKLPIEGKVGEERAPLLLKRFDPSPTESSEAEEIDEKPTLELSASTAKEVDQPAEASQAKEGEQAVEEGPKKETEEKAMEEGPKEEQEKPPPISQVRKNNQKSYGVLSLEEAVYINEFVKRLFYFKTFLFLAIVFTALIILSVARAQYGNVRADVAEILANE